MRSPPGRTQALALLRGLARLGRPAAERLEAALFGDAPPSRPPVFILGLPRSGTTLVYQAVCHALRVSFAPMLANSVPIAPALAAWLALRDPAAGASDFTSRYGRVAGWASPGEGTFWNLWFDKDRHYPSSDALAPGVRRQVLATVGRIERIGAGPFVNKNLRHLHRLSALAELFPEAVFLLVLRHPRDVALSLLRGRIEEQGDARTWFSIRPQSMPAAVTAEEQVVLQVAGLLADLRREMAAVGPQRFRIVDYASFCRTPRDWLSGLVDWLAARGSRPELQRRLPERFDGVSGRTHGLSPAQVAAVDRGAAEHLPEDPFAGLVGSADG